MITLIRAAVMLTVLVGLPAGWIFYDQLPKEARNAIQKAIETGQEKLCWDSSDAQTTDSLAAKPQVAREAPTYDQPALWGNARQAAIPEPQELVARTPEPQPTMANTQADLEPLLRQLRGLGVQQYELKTWGDAEQFYRFQCEMPLSVTSSLIQHFEAVAADPQESVAQVVAEVATWHADRQLR